MLLTNMALESRALGGGGVEAPLTDGQDPETKQTSVSNWRSPKLAHR